jgi:hypothetical protein
MKGEIMIILNLAGGKLAPLDIERGSMIVNVDKCYFDYITPDQFDNLYLAKAISTTPLYINHDVYDFMERTIAKFDRIAVYRFLEHVSKSNVQYFIYLLANCTKVGGEVDIIVPDAQLLARKLLDEDVDSPTWESDDLLITYELVADQPSPHLSIWTSDRLIKLFEREGNFKTKSVDRYFEFDGRNIYIRYKAIREK